MGRALGLRASGEVSYTRGKERRRREVGRTRMRLVNNVYSGI